MDITLSCSHFRNGCDSNWNSSPTFKATLKSSVLSTMRNLQHNPHKNTKAPNCSLFQFRPWYMTITNPLLVVYLFPVGVSMHPRTVYMASSMVLSPSPKRRLCVASLGFLTHLTESLDRSPQNWQICITCWLFSCFLLIRFLSVMLPVAKEKLGQPTQPFFHQNHTCNCSS